MVLRPAEKSLNRLVWLGSYRFVSCLLELVGGLLQRGLNAVGYSDGFAKLHRLIASGLWGCLGD